MLEFALISAIPVAILSFWSPRLGIAAVFLVAFGWWHVVQPQSANHTTALLVLTALPAFLGFAAACGLRSIFRLDE